MNHYEILNVPRTADNETIRKAYKNLIFLYHPDRCQQPGAAARCRLLNWAYEILNDAALRAEYDAELRAEEESQARQQRTEERQSRQKPPPSRRARYTRPRPAKAPKSPPKRRGAPDRWTECFRLAHEITRGHSVSGYHRIKLIAEAVSIYQQRHGIGTHVFTTAEAKYWKLIKEGFFQSNGRSRKSA